MENEISLTGVWLPAIVSIAVLSALLVGWNLNKLIDRIVAYKCRKAGKEPQGEFLTVLGRTVKHPLAHQRFWFCLLLTASFVASVLFFPLWEAPFLGVFAVCALICSIVDNRIHIIPNEMMLGMFGLSLLYRLVSGGWKDMLFAFLSCFACGVCFLLCIGLFKLLTGNLGMRAGDLKLLMVMGAACGYTAEYRLHSVTAAIFVMSIFILVFCTYGLITRSVLLKSYFPFSTFGMIGIMAGLFYPIYGTFLV